LKNLTFILVLIVITVFSAFGSDLEYRKYSSGDTITLNNIPEAISRIYLFSLTDQSFPKDTFRIINGIGKWVVPELQTKKYYRAIFETESKDSTQTGYFIVDDASLKKGQMEVPVISDHMVYPNPVNNKLYFSNGASEINICTIDGRVITSINESVSYIDVSDFGAGYYMISYKTKEDYHVEIMVKE